MTEASSTTDVVDELTTDHREASALLDQILITSDPAARRDMADTVITELVRHAVAEEMYVYPAIRDTFPNGSEVVEHDIEEHKELERTMKELEQCAADDPRFPTLVTRANSASSRTRRCWDTAGRLTGSRSASSPTERGFSRSIV